MTHQYTPCRGRCGRKTCSATCYCPRCRQKYKVPIPKRANDADREVSFTFWPGVKHQSTKADKILKEREVDYKEETMVH